MQKVQLSGFARNVSDPPIKITQKEAVRAVKHPQSLWKSVIEDKPAISKSAYFPSFQEAATSAAALASLAAPFISESRDTPT